MTRSRRAGALLAALAVASVLAACGSNDNGGVIEGPPPTSGPTSTAPSATPGY